MYTTDLQCTIPAIWCRVPSVQNEKEKELTEELYMVKTEVRGHTLQISRITVLSYPRKCFDLSPPLPLSPLPPCKGKPGKLSIAGNPGNDGNDGNLVSLVLLVNLVMMVMMVTW